MLVKNLLKDTEDFILLFEHPNTQTLLNNLHEMHDYYNDFENALLKVKSNGISDFKDLKKNITFIEDEALQSIRSLRPKTLINVMKKFTESINSLNFLGSGIRKSLNENSDKIIELHTDAYSDKGFEEIIKFLKQAKSYYKDLNSLKLNFSSIAESLTTDMPLIPEGNDIIDIQIVTVASDLKSFSKFLEFIEKFYSKLCNPFKIHHSDFPLTIIKIESGSIWSKLFGNAELIKFIKDFIFGIGAYIKDLQTGEINKQEFENKVKKADILIDLINKSEKLNNLDETSEKLLIKVYHQAILDISKSLPRSTTEIIIDDQSLLRLNEDQKALIEKKIPLLKENNQSHKHE